VASGAGLGGVVHQVVDLGVCRPSQVHKGLDNNERGWGDTIVVVGISEMALKPLVEEAVVPSNPEGGHWLMEHQGGRGGWGWQEPAGA